MLRTTKSIMETVHESTQSQRVLKGKGISIDQMFDNLDKGECYHSGQVNWSCFPLYNKSITPNNFTFRDKVNKMNDEDELMDSYLKMCCM